MTAGRSAPTRVLTGAAVAMAVGWLGFVLVWHDAPFTLTFDDAYYYFGIARNIAEGKGSSFDGLDLTNGYHPLWLGVCVLAFLAGLDDLAAVRTLLVLQIVSWGAAMVVLARSAGASIQGWPRLSDSPERPLARQRRWATVTVTAGLVLAAGNPFVVKAFVNGLESGVTVLLYAVLLAVILARPRDGSLLRATTSRWRLGVGVCLAVLFLGRTDAVIVVGWLALWVLATAWPLHWRDLRALLELFALPAVTVGVYLALNRAVFGTAVQISGLVKRAPLNGSRVVTLVAIGALALAITAWAARRRARPAPPKPPRFGRVGDFFAHTGWFASACVTIVAYYSVLQVQQWLWYYCPVVLYVLWMLVLALADFAESALVEAPANRSIARTLVPLQVLLLVPLVVAWVLQWQSFADPNLRSIQLANRDAGVWIDQNLPPDAVLASWDAGVVGYFSHRAVINLDGVVNSYEWYQATNAGTTGEYLRARDLGWVVNHGAPDATGQDAGTLAFVRSEFGDQAAEGTELVASWPFRFSGRTTGAGGDVSGTRDLEVFLYQLPQPLPPP